MATQKTSESLSMHEHPDIMEIRDRLDRVAETPQAWTVDGLAMLAGLYVAISPWVLNFHAGNPSLAMSNLVIGLAAAVLAGMLGSMYSKAHGLSWALPVMGAWIIVSMWAIRGTTPDTGILLSNIIAGGCLVLLGMAMMTGQWMRRPAHR